MNNVFTFPYSVKFYITHPWKFFSQLWINLRRAYFRATKGFCSSDVWNLSDWFLDVFPAMLTYLAYNNCAYPGEGTPFDTPKKWNDWLIKMAMQLEECKEENYEKLNEYYEDYMESFKDWKIGSPEKEETRELNKKYFARDRELAAEAHQKLKDTLAELAEHFYLLWD